MAEQALIAGPDTRTLTVIGSEIREHAARLDYHMRGTIWEAVEIGRRLAEARDMMEHGGWMDFLKRETPFSYDKARNLIRVYEAYGSRQTDLLGSDPLSNSETYRNLSFSQALELLALPSGEREAFVADKPVEDMTVRELREKVRQSNQQRDEALRAVEDARQESEGLALRVSELEARADTLSDELEDEKAHAAHAKEIQNKTAQDMRLLEELHAGTVEELEELRNRPVDVAVQTVRDEEAIEEAREAVRTEMQEKLDAAEVARVAAERIAKEHWEVYETAKQNELNAIERGKQLEEELAAVKADAYVRMEQLEAELEKARIEMEKIRAASSTSDDSSAPVSTVPTPNAVSGDPDLALFEQLFNQVQSDVNQLRGLLLKVRQRGNGQELANKLVHALLALSNAVKEVAA